MLNIKPTKCRASTYFASAALTAAMEKQENTIQKLISLTTPAAINKRKYVKSENHLVHLCMQLDLLSTIKLLMSKLEHGIDFFVYNTFDETPFDMIKPYKISKRIDRWSLDKYTARNEISEYMKTIGVDTWNANGNKIEQMVFDTCICFPTVLISLIGSYIPTRVRFLDENAMAPAPQLNHDNHCTIVTYLTCDFDSESEYEDSESNSEFEDEEMYYSE
jgi:hypothetical protein